MIFTSCPYCNEPQAFEWNGKNVGEAVYFPSRCSKCDKVMWVQATTIAGTCITHDQFITRLVKIKDLPKVEKLYDKATNLSGITVPKKEDRECMD